MTPPRAREIVDAKTFGAIVFDLPPTPWAELNEPPALCQRVEALCAVGVHLFVRCDGDIAAVAHHVGAEPADPGHLFFCVASEASVYEMEGGELVHRYGGHDESTDAGDRGLDGDGSAHWAEWPEQWLRAQGVTGSLILVIHTDPNENGPVSKETDRPSTGGFARATHVTVPISSGRGSNSLCHLLDVQLARRRARRVPDIDEDPTWVVTLPDERALERAAEALGTLGNGRAAIRAAREENGPGSLPLFAVTGMYSREPSPMLLDGPVWTNLATKCAVDRRLLDLRTGVLVRQGCDSSGLKTCRFVSAARPEALALRAEARTDALQLDEPFTTPSDCTGFVRQDRDAVALASISELGSGGIVVGVKDWHGDIDDTRVIDRVGAWAADPAVVPSWDKTAALVSNVDKIGFDRLLAEHRRTWSIRWADATVAIPGAPADELAARFAIFHLLAAAADDGEAAVGARGLTGTAYGGHVFWDADVFVLPVLAAIHPAAARAMLEYRIRRIAAARDIARRRGGRGARFPWESAFSGNDVTPRTGCGLHGESIPILTAEREEHIVADVAWAATQYSNWTGDTDFLLGPGSALVLETAQYWAARVQVGADGRGHIRGVMGPDEYHQVVDDNAYTNVMARWNLRAGAQLSERLRGRELEAADWRRVADLLVDGWDEERGLYQQFDGYWALEPLLAADAAPPPVAADVLLGVERVTGSQLIKQADVLMLHHLVPDDVVAGSLGKNLAFYEPRTVHGSSLSPAVHALLLARSGQPDRALELFRLAARLDLDDITGTTAGGLHLATMGGVWQALAFGFLGLRVTSNVLEVDPCLPDGWDGLSMRLRVRGEPVGVRADHGTVTVSCAQPLMVRVGPTGPQSCSPPSTTFTYERKVG